MTDQGLTPLSVIYCTFGAFIAFQHPARLAVPSALRAPSLREGWGGFRGLGWVSGPGWIAGKQKAREALSCRALTGLVFSFVDRGSGNGLLEDNLLAVTDVELTLARVVHTNAGRCVPVAVVHVNSDAAYTCRDKVGHQFERC